MSTGTNLLVRIFESFAENNTKPKTMRRLYCESGQAGIKAYRFVNYTTKKRLDEIIPKCKDCKHYTIKSSTAILVFEELTDNNCFNLLKEMYTQMGGTSKHAYKLCNKKTQHVIQKMGLHI